MLINSQLFHIWQPGSISKYVDQFSALVDQLVAYESDANPLYYAMRFVDGLKEDIRKVVMIKRPGNLDLACALALVQEEASDSSKRKDYRCAESYSYRFASKPTTLSLRPPKFDKPLLQTAGEDRR
jgi:hypothetical protein